ncbi:MAG: tRNA (adenosine(37)-N6)-dimethylallyltransferase MiaA [Succinivibrionaceae bacterium]|nr:tRNA (adenosine(37)-N6)-dimethylallyltransferase MiaA [Succinivibrionaceae bacterium]
MMEADAIAILGPTASGKSALALALAREVRAEIISLDSALVYRGMDIGTAKPSARERGEVPHHLIDILPPTASYSAADFRRDCLGLMPRIRARGALPIICGGTMMYYKALICGLHDLPPTSPEVRAQVQGEIARLGVEGVHALLAGCDPRNYQRLDPHDVQRVSRAREIFLQTGRAQGDLTSGHREGSGLRIREYVLLPREGDRAELRAKIRERFLGMLAAGLLDEVAGLVAGYQLDLGYPALRAVGYRQAYRHLRGEIDRAQMVEEAVVATCHLAKHQMTWLRGGLREGAGVRVELAMGDPEALGRILGDLR